jgi:hypothetical protein
MDKEDWIRRRAYNIWCAMGWPKGRDKEHWAQASNEAESEAGLTSEPDKNVTSPPLTEIEDARIRRNLREALRKDERGD